MGRRVEYAARLKLGVEGRPVVLEHCGSHALERMVDTVESSGAWIIFRSKALG
jgi:hypothetical protein